MLLERMFQRLGSWLECEMLVILVGKAGCSSFRSQFLCFANLVHILAVQRIHVSLELRVEVLRPKFKR